MRKISLRAILLVVLVIEGSILLSSYLARELKVLGYGNYVAEFYIYAIFAFVIIGQVLALFMIKKIKKYHLVAFDYPYYIIAGIAIFIGIFAFQKNVYLLRVSNDAESLNKAVYLIHMQCLAEYGYLSEVVQDDDDFHEQVCKTTQHLHMVLYPEYGFGVWLEGESVQENAKRTIEAIEKYEGRLRHSGGGYGFNSEDPFVPLTLVEDPVAQAAMSGRPSLSDLLYFNDRGKFDVYRHGDMLGPSPEIPEGRSWLTGRILNARDQLFQYADSVREWEGSGNWPRWVTVYLPLWPFLLGLAISIKLTKTTIEFTKAFHDRNNM